MFFSKLERFFYILLANWREIIQIQIKEEEKVKKLLRKNHLNQVPIEEKKKKPVTNKYNLEYLI